MNNFNEKVAFIWSVADLLRGPYRPNQYKDVMLPMTVLRRLDCVLEPTKEEVLEKMKKLKESKVKNPEPILCRVTGMPFYNTSRYTFERLKGDPNNIAANLTDYLNLSTTKVAGFFPALALHRFLFHRAEPPCGRSYRPSAGHPRSPCGSFCFVPH